MSSDLAVQYQNKITFSDLMNDFISFLDVAPSSVRAYKTGVRAFLSFMAENENSSPSFETVLNFKQQLLAKGRKPSTVALYLSSVKRFFAWCDKSGFYSNIARDVKAPKMAKGHKKDYFTGTQIRSILKTIDRSNCEGMRNYAVFALMSCCGLRTVEVSRAKVEDLRTVGGSTVLYIQGKGKTDKSDFVKVPEQVEEAIRRYLKLRTKVDATDALFTSESKRNHGQLLTTRTISSICKSAMLNAGFNSDRLTAHSLRHSAVTLALLAGQPLTDVQAFARHSSINTTMIYNHALDKMKSQCENAVANSIF